MELKFLCEAAGLICPDSLVGGEVGAICTDSRAVVENSLFVCIKGLHNDGHAMIFDAISRGARWAVVQKGCDYSAPEGFPILVAEDTRRACARLYNAYYGFPTERMKFIGVTGTNGKTSVTHLLLSILETSLCKCGLIGTVGCKSAGRPLENRMFDHLANMTTPDPSELYRMLAEMASEGVEYVLMEATSHALALGKLDPIEFEAAIFTNLTPDHLDFHGTMEAYARAKSELFRKSKLSIVNSDDPAAEQMIRAGAGRVVTCSQTGLAADYTAKDIRDLGRNGVAYTICSENSRLSLQCAIPGSFSVMNSMQAAICAKELGFGASAIKDALASVGGVRGRMERLKLGPSADFSVIIDYAHTPDALEKLLRTARTFCRKDERVVIVFGCGGDRDRSKRPIMGAIASEYADEVIVTSDNSRSEDPAEIIREILAGIDPTRPARVIPDRATAIETAILTARTGDIILLAGKGHEEYEITKEGRKPFSEREIVHRALAAREKARRP
ncbi:MAG: UDP-N-acetylmuramoyl-L-alanyl-D-glutamate--2,6-diaminopimelate ligase [Clostridia bacterium]|nr:UDP-N-acetylmuramoyl-L-alanyl-D-glutamate--2,6-diaminopimelate ligase [Clostridia bacterium]